MPLRRRNCISSCELSLGSPSFHQVLLSVKSLTHVCLSEFLWWKLKQLCFTFGMGSRKPKRQRRLREQCKTCPPYRNVAEILFYFPQAQLLEGQR